MVGVDVSASGIPVLMTKADLAALIQVSKRQVEVLVSRGVLPKPQYFGTMTPRWVQSEVVASLQAKVGG